MKLFNRKKDNSTPDEIKNYYAEERRDRTGVAWLLAAATLVVTLLLALGLFYGGRWAYRAIFDNGDDNLNTVQQEAGETEDQLTDQTVDEAETNGTDETDANTDEAVMPGDETEEPSTGNQADDDGQTTSSSDDRLPSSGALPATGPIEPEL